MDKFILIPAFNPGNALIKQVDDIQKQTDIPILIVDDGNNPEIKISEFEKYSFMISSEVAAIKSIFIWQIYQKKRQYICILFNKK